MSDTSLNTIIQYGTAAERTAFVPNPAAGSQVLYIWYETDNAPDTYVWNGAAWVQINAVSAGINELTGDVTAGPGSGAQAATIANNAVTNAKLRDSTAMTVIGRQANSTGDPADIEFVNFNYAQNLIINGGMRFAQRIGNSNTLAPFSDTASRTYVFDRWAITNENASVDIAQAQTNVTPQAGITARHYARYQKVTATGKICVSQVIEAQNMMHTRGKTVRLQIKMKASSALDFRLALLELQAAGTTDTVPGYSGGAPSGTFISAFGVDGTDPTFGTNLAKITPTEAYNSTIANDGLDCAVTTDWQEFGGTFTIPSDCLNLVLVIFSDNQLAAADELDITEVDIHLGFAREMWNEYVTYTDEFMKCQRYYTKSFGLVTTPAQNAGLSSAVRGYVSVAGATAGQPIGLRFVPQLRVGPASGTITFYNPSAANAFARNTSVGADATATAIANSNAVGGDIQFTGVAGWLAGAAMAVHYTVDVEL